MIHILRNIHPRRRSVTCLELTAILACALISLAYVAILFCPHDCLNKLLTSPSFSRIVGL